MRLLEREAGQDRRRSPDCKCIPARLHGLLYHCFRYPCSIEHAIPDTHLLFSRPDGTIDRSGESGAPVKSAGNAAAHKLGPKANTGAINAGLRALDRSGKPCRRWEKKGLQLKSFTGTVWGMSSWKAPTRANGLDANGETKSDSSSEVKPPGSSALPSDKESHGGDPGDTTMMTGMESSPAPVATPA